MAETDQGDDAGGPRQVRPDRRRPRAGRRVARLCRLLPVGAPSRQHARRSCPLPWVAGEIPRLGEASAERYGASVAGLTEVLATRLRALSHPDADAAAGSVVAELIGALTLARAVDDQAQSDLILARSRASVLARLGL